MLKGLASHMPQGAETGIGDTFFVLHGSVGPPGHIAFLQLVDEKVLIFGDGFGVRLVFDKGLIGGAKNIVGVQLIIM